MATYKKADLVDRLSDKLDMQKKETDRFIDFLFQEIADIMKEESCVNIKGFGKFEGVRRKGHKRHDINNNQVVECPEKITPVFRASRVLRIYVEEKSE